METSFQFATFLDDMDIDFEVLPSDYGEVCMEFVYDEKFYEVEFMPEGKLSVNGEVMTYKDLISNVF